MEINGNNLNDLHEVYISIGSNQGDRLRNIQTSIDRLIQNVGPVISCSSVYETPPVDYQTDALFYNLCIKIKTTLLIEDLLSELQKIETEMGRIRKADERYSDRIIDLDIIFYDNLKINSEKIIVPHPRYHLRKFVLIPLLEIAPNHWDFNANLEVKTLLSQCPDSSSLSKIESLVTF